MLGQVISAIEAGKSFKCLERPPEEGEIGVAKVSAVTWGEYQESESKTCLDPSRVQNNLFIQEGDFLFSRSNTIDLVGACVIAKAVSRNVMLSDKILRLTFTWVSPKFVLFYLRSVAGRRQIELLSTGNQQSMRNIGQERIRAIRLPIPPLAEQRRIVAKIEELFSELDKGVESLKTARAQLKTYRQSLLKAAFEGRLTEQWRRDNADKLETADQLLERIREEREACYQQQLGEWRAAVAEWEVNGKSGKKPRKPRLPKKLPNISNEDIRNLPHIPYEWKYLRLGTLIHTDVGYAFKSSSFSESGVRLLRGDNIAPGRLRWDNAKYWPEKRLSGYESLLVHEGDVVLAMDRPIISSGLKLAVVRPEDSPCLLVQRVARFRKSTSVDMRFLTGALSQKRFAVHCLGNQTGTQLPHISESQIREFIIPVCSAEEQAEIGQVLDEELSKIEHLEHLILSSIEKIEYLRQSILKRAFEGNLVPQDPNDEPASALLERIRQEQADAPKIKRRTRKARTPA
ncbi:restriction endonuclease subunit S [Alkalispirillum mobile]|uniref:restriction endonuclease subunit S n=1 Tax=Alkalispirillum mobile TaxID=85925 RepID=UPI00147563A6|nr:restriction endonuclease subunit S [Alkalispirillum mobile]